MSTFSRPGLYALLAFVCAGWSQGALAGSASCGVTGSAAAPASVTFDPFAGSSLAQAYLPLMLTRTRGAGGESTSEVSFVLTKPLGTPAYQITYAGTSVLYTEGATMGHPALPSHGTGEIYHDFGGNTQPDTVELPTPLVVTIPAHTDLTAGRPIEFDILYVCKGSDGMADVSTPTRLPGAIRIDVNVLSGVQASYVGSLLDFGEVGDVTTAQVLAAPGAYSTPASGNMIRVASSGPYLVEMRSENGYRLTFPGGNLGDDTQTLDYQISFLGQQAKPSVPAFVAVTCTRAGLDGVYLPVQARLLEGGKGEGSKPQKAAAPNYSDTVTVTISPLLDGSVGQRNCAAIALPTP